MHNQHWIRFVKDAQIGPVFPPDGTKTDMVVGPEVVKLVRTLRAYNDEGIEKVDLELADGTIVDKVPYDLFILVDDGDITYDEAYPSFWWMQDTYEV